MRAGWLSGLLWGLDTFCLGLVLAAVTGEGLVALVAPLLCSALHDAQSGLWLLLYQRCQPHRRRLGVLLRQKNGRRLIYAALIGGPLGMSAYVMAITFIGAGSTAVLSAFSPALGALLGHFFLKQRLKPYQWCALGLATLCVAGLGLTAAGGINGLVGAVGAGSLDFEFSSKIGLGIALALICVLSWAVETVLCNASFAHSESAEAPLSPTEAIVLRQITSALAYAGVFVGLIGWGIAQLGRQAFLPFAPLFQGLPGLILIGVGGVGALSFILYYRAIQQLGAGRAMALNFTYAGWAMVFSALHMRQWPSILEVILAVGLLAASLITAGVLEQEQ